MYTKSDFAREIFAEILQAEMHIVVPGIRRHLVAPRKGVKEKVPSLRPLVKKDAIIPRAFGFRKREEER